MKLEEYIKLLPNLFKRVKKLEKDGGNQADGVTWDSITEKPAVIASGTTQAAARQSIGAGTSNLTIGTTSTTAKAGNYQPIWADITDKPAIIASGATQAEARTAIGAGTGNSNLAIGTTASTAKAGNYTPSATEVVNALNAMTPEQIGEIQTLLGITPA